MRLIVRESSGLVQVLLQRPGVVVPMPASAPQPFAAPLSTQEMEDLRWYLEDYLQAPFAVYEERGSSIQAQIDEWGVRLFEALFARGTAGRDAYLKACSAAGGWSLWIVSDSPDFLSLPWEMMRDPEHPDPLALDVSVNRTIDVDETPATGSGAELRVLMVIARPGGEHDVGYRVIARSLVERLPTVSGRVTVHVLRPPTLDELRRRLERACVEGKPYHVVHFDGHGTFGQSAGAYGHIQFGKAPRGYVVFEKETGGENPVPAEDFGTVLKNAGVPLLVFNACRSATLAGAGATEAAVATRVLHAGASAVVAMSYSVYVAAAAEFMAAFYEALFHGVTVEIAVRAGRRQMRRAGLRPSPQGLLPLDDWMVPVHYARSEVRFPGLVREAQNGDRFPGALLAQTRPTASAAAKPVAGVHLETSLQATGGVFLGRDREFVKLETALRHRHVVVLHGLGGTGKTELAKAFARWLRDTDGVDAPQFVFFQSFEPGDASYGLSGVVTGIGLRVFGPDFVRNFPTTSERAAAILEFMRQHRALLVWDNFETVHSMPDPAGATPRLDAPEQSEIRDFLTEAARGSRGGVIITSRSAETWLGDVHRLEVGGLDRDDAVQYADVLLAPWSATRERRKARAFGELLELLAGHPLAMRLVLPHLERSDAAGLLRAMREPALGSTASDRMVSLAACVHYSFQHLREPDRRLLPALSLFVGVCDATVLWLLGDTDGVPERFRGVDHQHWTELLDRCVEVGLLTWRGSTQYDIHPALPGFLSTLWSTEVGSGCIQQEEEEAARRALAKACGSLGEWATREIQGGRSDYIAIEVVRSLRRTLSNLVLAALGWGDLKTVLAILHPLATVLEMDGAGGDLASLQDCCRERIEGPLGTVPDLSTDEGALWLFVTDDLSGAEAASLYIDSIRGGEDAPDPEKLLQMYSLLGVAAQHRGDRSTAKTWWEKALQLAERLQLRSARETCYFNLGDLALEAGDTSAAEAWFRQSLALQLEMESNRGLARCYMSLGRVAIYARQFHEAAEWYGKGFEIMHMLGDQPALAVIYHNLGMISENLGDLSAATFCHHQAALIKHELNDSRGLANSYLHLGNLAVRDNNLSAAEAWYQSFLKIVEERQDRRGIANGYMNLGVVAEKRGEFGYAETWYHKALPLIEEVGNVAERATLYLNLGVVVRMSGIPSAAAEWYHKSRIISEEIGDRRLAAKVYGELGMLSEHAGHVEDALDWMIRAVTLFQEFPHIDASPVPYNLFRLTGDLGIPALGDAWVRTTGNPLPPEVLGVVTYAIEQLGSVESAAPFEVPVTKLA